jgi:hypothetical protein
MSPNPVCALQALLYVLAPLLIVGGLLMSTSRSYARSCDLPKRNSSCSARPYQHQSNACRTGKATKTPNPSTRHSSQTNSDDCALIASSEFRSIDKYEIGLGPNGEVMGYWSVRLQNDTAVSNRGQGTFEWHHSDVSETGTFECKNPSREEYQKSLQAQFDVHCKAAHSQT